MRLVGLAALLAVLALLPAGSASGAGALDARALVAQPLDVGGVRTVAGEWNSLGDDGVYPLADAIGSQATPTPGNISYLARYDGVAGAARGSVVSSLAVVLPTARVARRLLARTDAVEEFVSPPGGAPVSPVRPLDGADAMRRSDPTSTTTAIAWTDGRLYGLVVVRGPGAPEATRLARAQERRFARALAGTPVTADHRFTAPPQLPSSVPPPLALVNPARTVRIDRAGRYTLRDLGVDGQTFTPSASSAGFSFPVTLDLPDTPTGRWLWRATVHVRVTLAAGAPAGTVQVEELVASTGGPGAQFDVERDLSTGRAVLIEQTRGVATSRTLDVTARAMVGGTPSPRQQTTIGFAVVPGTSAAAFARVTVLPDSAIEVFDDPARIGRYAVDPAKVVARP